MKIQINSLKLKSMTGRLLKIIDKKSPLPVMQDFLIEVCGGVFSITAMNANVTSKEYADVVCNFDSDIQFVVGSSSFTEFFSKIAGESKDDNDICINISPDIRKLVIKYPSGRITFPCEVTTTFPVVAVPSPDSQRFKVNGKTLAKMMNCVSPIVQEDELRPVLSNISVKIKEGGMEVVAFNPYELRVCTLDGAVDEGVDKRLLISPKMYEVIYWYISMKEDIEIIYEDSKTFFNVGPAMIYQVNPEGSYLDYNRVVSKLTPENCTQSFVVDKRDFIKHIERVETVANNLFTINIDDQRSYIVNDGETDIKVEEDFDFSAVEGHKVFNSSFNIRRFKNALKNIESKSIEIKKCDPVRCGYFEEVDSDNIRKLFLLMSFITN